LNINAEAVRAATFSTVGRSIGDPVKTGTYPFFTNGSSRMILLLTG
jgi:hypothetical protein